MKLNRTAKSKDNFEKHMSGKPLSAVVANALPAIIAMLMVLIYNLADTFFIGQTHDDLQVAAVSLATPAFLLFMAVGNIFGIGGTAVISRSIGEKDFDYAKKICSFCMWCCVIFGVLMSAVFLIFMDPILKLLGASSDTWEFTKTYLMIVSLCGPFSLIANCFSNILRAEGQVTKAMVGQVAGNLLNVILDPIMILSFKWNIAGAAIATVIGNIAAAVYYIMFYMRGESTLSISPKYFSIKKKISYSVLVIGIPASLASLLMSISQIIMNSLMASYSDMALAGIGVAMKATMITGMISLGLGQGMQPLFGYCIGAKREDKYKQFFRISVILSFAVSLFMTAICFIFTKPIVGVFLTDSESMAYGIKFVRILLSTSALIGLYFIIINALQARGLATPSLIVNLSRQGLIYIPVLFMLNYLAGVYGLVWAQPVTDVTSTILAVFLYTRAASAK